MLLWVIITWLIISGLILFHPFHTLSQFFVIGLNPFLGFIFQGCLVLAAVALIIFVRKILLKFPAIKSLEVADWFVIGGIACFMTVPFMNSNNSLDIHLHDTYAVIDGGIVRGAIALFFGLCAAIYYFFSNMAKRPLNRTAGWIHFWATLTMIILIFIPMRYERLADMPRSYMDYSRWGDFQQFARYNLFILGLTVAFLAGQSIFICNIIYTIFTLRHRFSRRDLLPPASHSYPRKPPSGS